MRLLERWWRFWVALGDARIGAVAVPAELARCAPTPLRFGELQTDWSCLYLRGRGVSGPLCPSCEHIAGAPFVRRQLERLRQGPL